MKNLSVSLLFVVSLCLVPAVSSAQGSVQDTEGCKDYPLFNRMPDYHIAECESIEFDARKFPTGPPLDNQVPRHVEVEGALTFLRYELNDGANAASGLQIMRNFENATNKGGGTVEGKYPDWCTATVEYDGRLGNTCTYWGLSMRFQSSGKEVWAYMQVMDDGYGLQIIEREAMKQDIVINAAKIQEGLDATGHIAIYDILFDTGSSALKPESDRALQEIANLLSQDPSLKLHVVGHTDNVGKVAANMELSQARASSVVSGLTGKHGISPSRLTSFGAGPYAPVASNKTEEGRAKNRRVELVQQ